MDLVASASEVMADPASHELLPRDHLAVAVDFVIVDVAGRYEGVPDTEPVECRSAAVS